MGNASCQSNECHTIVGWQTVLACIVVLSMNSLEHRLVAFVVLVDSESVQEIVSEVVLADVWDGILGINVFFEQLVDGLEKVNLAIAFLFLTGSSSFIIFSCVSLDITLIAQFSQAETNFEELESEHIILSCTISDLSSKFVLDEWAFSLQVDLRLVNIRSFVKAAPQRPNVKVLLVNSRIGTVASEMQE